MALQFAGADENPAVPKEMEQVSARLTNLVLTIAGAATAIGLGALLVKGSTGNRRSISSKSGQSSIPHHSHGNDAPVVHGIEGLIGNTPLVRIKSLSEATGCDIYGKAEFMNVGQSSKDRLALAVITDAERRGVIVPHRGDTIFEGTVGSTGISLALIARAKGYKSHIVMPDDQAAEKYLILEQLGATVEKVRPVSIADANHFTRIAKARADEVNASGGPARGLFCDQFDNEINFETHYLTTGPEILRQTHGAIDAFVMGAGTGGTLSGVGTYLKHNSPATKVILADPEGSGLFNKVKYNVMYAPTEAEGTRRRHQVDSIVEGIGINRLTRNMEKGLVAGCIDDAVKVTDAEALEMSRYLLKNDGKSCLFLGSSSAVNCAAAFKVAQQMKKGSVIVTVLCDPGSRHLTKFWNPEVIKKWGISESSDLFGTLTR
ncbi:tryptophan synthase beta subunit-like PLP-dependent enzyme [Zopfochytrium polystomum]|nr:tryptophan synthase beta subunit-like PLP-dependent enzyme [Zopfochytrium polystomum]